MTTFYHRQTRNSGTARSAPRQTEHVPRVQSLPISPYQGGKINPEGVLQLQRTVGNLATQRLLSDMGADHGIRRKPGGGSRLVSGHAPDNVLQTRPIEKVREDIGTIATAIASMDDKTSATDIKSKIDSLQTLKTEATKDGHKALVPRIDALLRELVGVVHAHRDILKEEERTGLMQAIATAIGESTTKFTHIAVGLYAPAIGGKAKGGEFADPTLAEEEKAERRRLRKEHGLRARSGARDDKRKDEPDFEVDVRVNLLEKAMQIAYEGYLRENATRGDVLPVFQAPEWFFRRPDRPYTPAEKDAVVAKLAEVSKKYPNMLIVGGTILWASGMDNPGPKGENIKLRNTAPIVINGLAKHVYDKKNEGGDTSGYEGLNIGMKNWTPGTTKNTFNVSNVSFAIDICADTSDGKAKQNYYATHPEGRKGGSGVDVHLITANSSGVANTVARPGGFILNTDSAYVTNEDGTPKDAHPTGRLGIRQAKDLAKTGKPLLTDTKAPGTDVSPDKTGIYRGTLALPATEDLDAQLESLNEQADALVEDDKSGFANIGEEYVKIGESGRDPLTDLLLILAWARENHHDRIRWANKIMYESLLARARQLGNQSATVPTTDGRMAFVPLDRLAHYVVSEFVNVNPRFQREEADAMARQLRGFPTLKAKVEATKDDYLKNYDNKMEPEKEIEQLLNILSYTHYHLDRKLKGKSSRVQGMRNKLQQIIQVNNANVGPNLELGMYVQMMLSRLKTH